MVPSGEAHGHAQHEAKRNAIHTERGPPYPPLVSLAIFSPAPGSNDLLAPCLIRYNVQSQRHLQLNAPASQLVDWARQRFYQEVSKPDERITLAKACMLIALEEEAAAALAQDQLDIRQTLRVSSTDPLLYSHPAHTSSRSLL